MGRQVLVSVEVVIALGLFAAVLDAQATSSGESLGVGGVFGSRVGASHLHPECIGLGSKIGLLDWLNNLSKNDSGKKRSNSST